MSNLASRLVLHFVPYLVLCRYFVSCSVPCRVSSRAVAYASSRAVTYISYRAAPQLVPCLISCLVSRRTSSRLVFRHAPCLVSHRASSYIVSRLVRASSRRPRLASRAMPRLAPCLVSQRASSRAVPDLLPCLVSCKPCLVSYRASSSAIPDLFSRPISYCISSPTASYFASRLVPFVFARRASSRVVSRYVVPRQVPHLISRRTTSPVSCRTPISYRASPHSVPCLGLYLISCRASSRLRRILRHNSSRAASYTVTHLAPHHPPLLGLILRNASFRSAPHLISRSAS